MLKAKSARVLVVDDDPTIREVLCEALTMEGYEVRGAGNGREALDVMSRWLPGLILLDLMMPELDGWGFREEQLRRGECRNIPVIVLSAARHLADQVSTLDPAEFFAKPFELDSVLGAVERILPPRSA